MSGCAWAKVKQQQKPREDGEVRCVDLSYLAIVPCEPRCSFIIQHRVSFLISTLSIDALGTLLGLIGLQYLIDHIIKKPTPVMLGLSISVYVILGILLLVFCLTLWKHWNWKKPFLFVLLFTLIYCGLFSDVCISLMLDNWYGNPSPDNRGVYFTYLVTKFFTALHF